jgi:hypothetical protein
VFNQIFIKTHLCLNNLHKNSFMSKQTSTKTHLCLNIGCQSMLILIYLKYLNFIFLVNTIVMTHLHKNKDLENCTKSISRHTETQKIECQCERGPRGPEGPMGPEGPPGKDGEVTVEYLQQHTIWCDDQVCSSPKPINTNGQPLLLKDEYHGLVYRPDMDGPSLYGYGGGVLGTRKMSVTKNKDALKWDETGQVSIDHSLVMGNWKIYQDDVGCLVIVNINDTGVFRFTPKGNLILNSKPEICYSGANF